MNQFEASVLLPLMDDRRTGEACVRAWTQGQTFPPGRYEVVALAPGVNPGLERAVRPMLRPQDRWITHDTPIVVDLLNVGAQHARGRLLFLTESHCEPDPKCLANMVRHLEVSGEAGARGSSIGRSHGALGELERMVFEEGLHKGEVEREWDRVLIHSFAIRRDVFLEAGGFVSRFGNYSHFALALELLDRGHRLGFAPEAVVYHTYEGELRKIAAYLRNYGAGEIAYCETELTELRQRRLIEAPEWTNRQRFTRSGARRALKAAIAARTIDSGIAYECMEHAIVVAGGLGGAYAFARASEAANRLLVWTLRGTGATRRRALDRWWRAGAHLGRIMRLRAQPPCAPAAKAPSEEVDLLSLGGASLMGFHVVEEWDGRRFRWTSPLALVEVAPPVCEPLEARLEVLPIGPPGSLSKLRVVADGRLVDPTSYRRELDGIRFLIPPDTSWLAFVTPTLRPRRHGSVDHRDLGLAVASLRFSPAAE